MDWIIFKRHWTVTAVLRIWIQLVLVVFITVFFLVLDRWQHKDKSHQPGKAKASVKWGKQEVNGNFLTGEASLNDIENQTVSRFTDAIVVKYPVKLLCFYTAFSIAQPYTWRNLRRRPIGGRKQMKKAAKTTSACYRMMEKHPSFSWKLVHVQCRCVQRSITALISAKGCFETEPEPVYCRHYRPCYQQAGLMKEPRSTSPRFCLWFL